MKARIKVDRDRVIGGVNNAIFGGLLEHAMRIVYGSVCDESHPLSDADGVRGDVAKAFRDMGMSVLRWPGGNFASGYHWEDGVGSTDTRPVRYDLEWQVEESNHFGTDEFLRFCKRVNAEPYICVNAGNGTAEEAAHWVEYCNYGGSSTYANLRAKNGHPEPYGVKYWGIGNELYGRGQIGRMDVGQYIDCVKEFARLMKKVDPTIRLVAVGWEKSEWNFRLVKECGEYFDYLSAHTYYVGNELMPFAEAAACALLTGEQLYEMQCAIDAASYYIKDRRRRPIEIAFDEWNLRVWRSEKFIEWLSMAFDYLPHNRELRRAHSVLPDMLPIRSREELVRFNQSIRDQELAGSVVGMSDAVYTAAAFHAMFRMGDRVTLAAFSPAVSSEGPFSVHKDGVEKHATYHVLRMYAKNHGSRTLDVFTDSPAYRQYMDSSVYNTNRIFDVPYLDAAATWDPESGALYLSVVNRHETEAAEVSITLDGFTACGSRMETLTGADTEPVSAPVDVYGLRELQIPPKSVNMLQITCEIEP